MDKAPDAFRTISEVAADLDVPQHVLRFWESRFTQIKPMKRGGGRRYYRPEDVELLRGIRHLLYGEGYTIRGVQRILRDQGVKFVQAVWQEGAVQPPHRAGAEPEDAESGEAAEAETPRGRGLFGRMPALFARDGEDDEPDEAPERSEPALADTPRPAASGAPSIDNMIAAPVAAPAGLSRDDLRKLQATLHELSECRRLLATALEERG